ncbi:hypothetical protein M378DRAFT_164249 [Amanita muscaria Koide BX008]|uniref:Uncharacterized protein n=1 Tax=Amanita muscaria (strain Koide BX008) TaxID=946122 RepID=A0A0C2WPK8_AMAMK|nr:hypothetical protein M378DRAFT_164249 [Amanita muscaria Koide BX008]
MTRLTAPRNTSTLPFCFVSNTLPDTCRPSRLFRGAVQSGPSRSWLDALDVGPSLRCLFFIAYASLLLLHSFNFRSSVSKLYAYIHKYTMCIPGHSPLFK